MHFLYRLKDTRKTVKPYAEVTLVDDETTVSSLKKSSSGTDLGKIEAMLLRDDKLTKAESLTGKFLEAADGYHRIVKKTIEKRSGTGVGVHR